MGETNTRDRTLNAPYLDDNSEIFESDNLAECLENYKETGDFSHLSIAIENTQDKCAQAVIELQLLIDVAIAIDNSYFKNKLINIRKKLEL